MPLEGATGDLRLSMYFGVLLIRAVNAIDTFPQDLGSIDLSLIGDVVSILFMVARASACYCPVEQQHGQETN